MHQTNSAVKGMQLNVVGSRCVSRPQQTLADPSDATRFIVLVILQRCSHQIWFKPGSAWSQQTVTVPYTGICLPRPNAQ